MTVIHHKYSIVQAQECVMLPYSLVPRLPPHAHALAKMYTWEEPGNEANATPQLSGAICLASSHHHRFYPVLRQPLGLESDVEIVCPKFPTRTPSDFQ